MNELVLLRYLDHLAEGNRVAALDVVMSLVDSGTPAELVVEQLVCAAQVEVGRRWERNEWSVAQEHAATAVTEAVLHAVLAAEGAEQGDATSGTLVAVCVEGEWHTTALAVVTGIVRRAGWDVTFLGPSVPVGHLGRYLHDVGPVGVLVSCSVSLNLPGARRVIEAARETGTPVLAGGRGFGPDGRYATTLGADAWAPNASAAVDRLRSWARFTTPAPPLRHPGHAEHLAMERRYDELVRRSMEALVERFPPAAQYDDERRDRTIEDLRYLLRFVSAALLVDDAELLAEYLSWLLSVLTSRGLPPTVLPVTIDAVTAALDDFPIAREMVRSARIAPAE